jgi:hypothetical protein
MFISFCLSLFIFGSSFCPTCCWCCRQPFLYDIADPLALANLMNQKVKDFKQGGPAVVPASAVVPAGAPNDIEMAR